MANLVLALALDLKIKANSTGHGHRRQLAQDVGRHFGRVERHLAQPAFTKARDLENIVDLLQGAIAAITGSLQQGA